MLVTVMAKLSRFLFKHDLTESYAGYRYSSTYRRQFSELRLGDLQFRPRRFGEEISIHCRQRNPDSTVVQPVAYSLYQVIYPNYYLWALRNKTRVVVRYLLLYDIL